MRNILTICNYTFREALSRKIFLTFFGVSSLVLLIFSLIFATVSIEDMLPVVNVNGENQVDNLVSELTIFFKTFIIVPLYGGGLFLSIFSVSSFIPNMLEKGNIDLLLSKPVSRSQIIWGKFAGGSIMVLLNVAYLVTGIWLLIGLKFSDWGMSLLYSIPSITFAFMVLYAMIVLIGILTRSSILAMMLTYLIFFIFSPLLVAREQIYLLFDSEILEFLIDSVYYILPKTSELGKITVDLVQGRGISDYQPIWTSLLFLILNLSLSIITFSKKDY
ncbi:MAG: ABC transporter permease subunit [Melioribacteraceae bacterium]|nr:ABC transporter permease subunit [Melioribacteraceae bacterium]